MTRHYAARRLLEHGPLTRAEFIAITGWSRKIASNILRGLWSIDVVTLVTVEGEHVYALAQGGEMQA